MYEKRWEQQARDSLPAIKLTKLDREDFEVEHVDVFRSHIDALVKAWNDALKTLMSKARLSGKYGLVIRHYFDGSVAELSDKVPYGQIHEHQFWHKNMPETDDFNECNSAIMKR